MVQCAFVLCEKLIGKQNTAKFLFFGFPKTNPDLKKKEEEEAEEV